MFTTVEVGRDRLFGVRWALGQGQTNFLPTRWAPLNPAWTEWHDGGEVGPAPEKYVPVDLTGWHARLQVRQKPGEQNAPWFTVTDEPSEDGVITLGDDGTIMVRIEASATSRLGTSARKPGTVDLELVRPDGDVITYFRGTAYFPEFETTLEEHPDE